MVSFCFSKAQKYNNIKVESGGIVFDSKLELECYYFLQNRFPNSKIEIHKKYVLTAHDKKICMVKPDFVVTHKDGEWEVIDAKTEATFTTSAKLKYKIFEAEYGKKIQLYPKDFIEKYNVKI